MAYKPLTCPGTYTVADKVRDNVVIERSGGRYAVGTCPFCLCRVSVMRPTGIVSGTRRGTATPNRLNFGRHHIAGSRMNRIRIDADKAIPSGPLTQTNLF